MLKIIKVEHCEACDGKGYTIQVDSYNPPKRSSYSCVYCEGTGHLITIEEHND